MKKLFITGHVGKDPEVRFSPTGEEFVSFSLACDKYNDQEATEWVEVSCNKKTRASLFNTVVEHVKKGTRLLCIGKNKIGAYADRTTGKPIPTESLYLHEMEFQSTKRDHQTADQSVTTEAKADSEATTVESTEPNPEFSTEPQP